MKVIRANKHRGKFKPLAATRSAQVALMELSPGGKSDDALSNEHPRSEQWCYVVSGTGQASVVSKDGTRRSAKLTEGSLLVIEKGERHQIKNSGTKILQTINFYVPPAYRPDGELRNG